MPKALFILPSKGPFVLLSAKCYRRDYTITDNDGVRDKGMKSAGQELLHVELVAEMTPLGLIKPFFEVSHVKGLLRLDELLVIACHVIPAHARFEPLFRVEIEQPIVFPVSAVQRDTK